MLLASYCFLGGKSGGDVVELKWHEKMRKRKKNG